MGFIVKLKPKLVKMGCNEGRCSPMGELKILSAAAGGSEET